MISLYYKEVLDFLSSLTIKFTPFAKYYKIAALDKGIVITEDTKNPYYLNLCGEYSVLDEPMYVSTVETNTEVLFDKNLRTNYPKTYTLYTSNGKELQELNKKYPKQTGLIKSIIYPAESMDVVLKANNLEMLAYNKDFLYSKEQQIILENIKEILEYLDYQWYVWDFDYEELYPVTFYGMVFQLLFASIVYTRINNLKTDKAHPTHILEYLTSKGLGDYITVLTNEQLIFLYKNISYILQNKGKKSNLEILASNILANLNISIYGKNIHEQPNLRFDICRKTPYFVPEEILSLTTLDKSYFSSNILDMESILYKMYNKEVYPKFSIDNTIEMEEKFGHTNLNILPTRLLELKKESVSTIYIQLLAEFMVDNLMYNLTRNSLQFKIKFIDTNTNTSIQATVPELIALFHYVHQKTLKEEATYLPKLYSTRIAMPRVKPGDIFKKVTYNNFTYKTDSLIDRKAILNSIPFSNEVYTNQLDFQNILEAQFRILVHYIRMIRTSADDRFHSIMLRFFNSFLIHQDLDLNLGYNTYDEFFNSTKGYAELMKLYEDLNDPSYYGMLRTTILEQLMPLSMPMMIDFGLFSKNNKLADELTKLFIQLCSYRLLFFDTDRQEAYSLLDNPEVLKDVLLSIDDFSKIYKDATPKYKDNIKYYIDYSKSNTKTFISLSDTYEHTSDIINTKYLDFVVDESLHKHVIYPTIKLTNKLDTIQDKVKINTGNDITMLNDYKIEG